VGRDLLPALWDRSDDAVLILVKDALLCRAATSTIQPPPERSPWVGAGAIAGRGFEIEWGGVPGGAQRIELTGSQPAIEAPGARTKISTRRFCARALGVFAGTRG